MDALNVIVDRRRRKSEVERLVDAEVEQFMRWWKSLDAGPVIRDLHHAFEAIRAAELDRNAKRFVEKDREQLDIFSRNLVRKLLMGLTTEIKQYHADDPEEAERLAVLRRVFHLDSGTGDEADDDAS